MPPLTNTTSNNTTTSAFANGVSQLINNSNNSQNNDSTQNDNVNNTNDNEEMFDETQTVFENNSSEQDDSTDENSPESEDTQQGKTDEESDDSGETTQKINIMGKEFTVDELAKAYKNSSLEGQRLYKVNKELQSKISEYEKKLLEYEAKLLETPPFKLLSDEELELLSPKEQAQYLLKKEKWEEEIKTKKEQLQKMQQEEAKRQEELRIKIISKAEEMIKDEKNYPDYKELMPVMDYIIDKAPFLTGYEETPEIVYFLALGLKYYNQIISSKNKELNERNKIVKSTTSKASAINSTGRSEPVSRKGRNESEELFDFNYNKNIF